MTTRQGTDTAVNAALPSPPTTALITRALWFGLAPVLLAGVAFRYLVPSHNAEMRGPLASLAQVGAQYPALLAVGLYLLFASLVRYWAPWLPGADTWLPRPATQARIIRKELLLWGGMLSLAVVAALGLRAFYKPYRVLSGSMLPTLEPGAHVLTSNAAYGLPYLGAAKLPARGDVVVFKKDLGPGYPEELVKRVIGLPGDRVSVEAGYASINGWKVPTCDAGLYVYASAMGLLEAHLVVEFLGDRVYLTAHSNAEPAPDVDYTVAAGEVFLLGDNRNNSSDSRSWNTGKGGGLPVADIRGRVDRLLVGVRRNGDVDAKQLLRPLGVELELEGLDGSGTRARIATCLKERPKQTQPPLHTATDAQSSSAGSP